MQDFARLLRRFDRARGKVRTKQQQRAFRRDLAQLDHRARGKLRRNMKLRIALG